MEKENNLKVLFLFLLEAIWISKFRAEAEAAFSFFCFFSPSIGRIKISNNETVSSIVPILFYSDDNFLNK